MDPLGDSGVEHSVMFTTFTSAQPLVWRTGKCWRSNASTDTWFGTQNSWTDLMIAELGQSYSQFVMIHKAGPISRNTFAWRTYCVTKTFWWYSCNFFLVSSVSSSSAAKITAICSRHLSLEDLDHKVHYSTLEDIWDTVWRIPFCIFVIHLIVDSGNR